MADFEQRWTALEPNIEDRRRDPPPVLDYSRAFDPMPIAQRIGGTVFPNSGGSPAQPIPQGRPSELARALGTDELDKALYLQLLLHYAGQGQGRGQRKR